MKSKIPDQKFLSQHHAYIGKDVFVNLFRTFLNKYPLDRDIGFVILLDLIKGSNLRLEIGVCSVVSTMETSGAARKW